MQVEKTHITEAFLNASKYETLSLSGVALVPRAVQIDNFDAHLLNTQGLQTTSLAPSGKR